MDNALDSKEGKGHQAQMSTALNAAPGQQYPHQGTVLQFQNPTLPDTFELSVWF